MSGPSDAGPHETVAQRRPPHYRPGVPMRTLVASASVLAFIALAAAAPACAASSADSVPDSGRATGVDAAVDPVGEGGIVPPVVTGDAAVGPVEKTYFYAHTDTTLYRLDADDPALPPQRIGDFDCVGRDAGLVTAMTDIAVDKRGRIVAVARDRVFLDVRVVGTSVVCGASVQLVGDASSTAFYGATFAPAGTLGNAEETLIVANNEGELYAVDLVTGALTIVGTFGVVPTRDPNGQTYPSANVGKEWALSGDLVFLDNGGRSVGFATVRDCPNPPSSSNCSTSDSLLELDLTKLRYGSRTVVTRRLLGRITADTRCTNDPPSAFGRTFGITAYKGAIFGFGRGSLVTRIDNTTAKACVISDLTGTLPVGFAGAGVTTAAPIDPPR